MHRYAFFTTLCCFMLLGCEFFRNDDDDDDYETPQACFEVVNGTFTEDYASVGMLVGEDSSICTGTFIAHNALITASHCVDGSADGGMRFTDLAEVADKDIFNVYEDAVEPLRVYSEGPSAESDDIEMGMIDLAVIIYPDYTAPEVSSILNRAPVDGDDLTMVGYGLTRIVFGGRGDGCPSTRKRVGANTMFSREVDGIYYSGRADTYPESDKTDDSLNAPGDSGGPVFIDGALAGIISLTARGAQGDERRYGYSYAVDLHTEESQDFLQEVISHEDLDITYE